MTAALEPWKAYVKERDELLRSLDIVRFEAFWTRHNLQRPAGGWSDPSVPMAMMHKCRLDIVSFTPEEKLVSAQWLLANSYQLPPPIELVDGKLIGAQYKVAEPCR